MKKLLLLTVPMSVLGYFVISPVTAQPPECVVDPEPMPACQNGRIITINNTSKTVNPRNLCIDPGDTVTFNVRPPSTRASVSAKRGEFDTVGGQGSFQLQVPPGQPFYDYNVHFRDDSCLDPRITVKTD